MRHIIVIMMENLGYKQVIGSSLAPYQNQLAAECGNASNSFSATHTSAANYMAVSAGEFPAYAAPGCGTVSGCSDSSPTLYGQLAGARLTWADYIEAMPFNCDPHSAGAYFNGHSVYTIGHNPALFYPGLATSCLANDIAVPSLTAASGPFWTALQNQALPSFSLITPDTYNDNEGPGTKAQNEQAADTFLQNFIGIIQASPSYQAGNTLVLITYDEGTGTDAVAGENCADKTADLAGSQGSCHVPLFVVYPFTQPGADPAFFTDYSITRTVEDVFGLPYLAHAADTTTNSLTGHFGIP